MHELRWLQQGSSRRQYRWMRGLIVFFDLRRDHAGLDVPLNTRYAVGYILLERFHRRASINTSGPLCRGCAALSTGVFSG